MAVVFLKSASFQVIDLCIRESAILKKISMGFAMVHNVSKA